MSVRSRGVLLGLVLVLTSMVWSASSLSVSAAPGGGFVEVEVARLLDTRPGATTVDGRFAGTGVLGPGEHVAFDVRGRAGVPTGIAAVAVTVTVTEPAADGFVTLYPCGVVPIASTVNYRAGQTVANSSITGLSAEGWLCVHTMSQTHVVVDVTGAFDSGFVPVPNARLLDTRAGEPTGDGAFAGGGMVMANGVVELQVAGRSGTPADAEAAALTITSTGSTRAGYVTAYPCGPRPLASTLNHTGGENRANSLVVPLDAAGRVCLFALAPTHLVVDVSGYVPSGSPYTPVTPARLADTRLDGVSVDGICMSVGRVATGTSMSLRVAGRGGVPATGVGAVVLNVVATGSKRPGFVTAHRADAAVPNASMLNYASADTVASSVIAPVDALGRVSLFSNVGVHLVVDVVGWLPGASSAPVADACSGTFVDPRQRYQRTDFANWRVGCTLLVTSEIQCWFTYMLGGRSNETPSRLFDGQLLELVGADGARCALRVDGTVACFQGYPVRAVREIPFRRPVVDIVGYQHDPGFCALDDEGSVWCWTPAVTPDRAAPVRVSTSGRGLGFVNLTMLGGPIAVRTDAGLADVVVHDGSGTFSVAGSSREASPGHPWSSVVAAAPHWSGELCLTLVDGRAVCGASGDLAPTIDVAWNDGVTLRDVHGRGVGIGWTEETSVYSSTPLAEQLILPTNLAQCYGSGTPRTDGWCRIGSPG